MGSLMESSTLADLSGYVDDSREVGRWLDMRRRAFRGARGR